jgi:transposase
VSAWRDDVIIELRRMVAELRARVANLESQLRQNSSNSGKPPSSYAPSEREQRPKPKPSGRPRGGQPGHKGHKRALLPPDQVTAALDYFPGACRKCGGRLAKKPSADPYRHQVVEVPDIRPDVTEHRLHEGCCADCGTVTRARLPDGVPAGMCSPRLVAVVALMTAGYNLSRRQATTLLRDVLGIRISLGALSESEAGMSMALEEPVKEALAYACRQPVKHVDATGWRQSGDSRSLWTIATTMVTVFAVTLRRQPSLPAGSTRE